MQPQVLFTAIAVSGFTIFPSHAATFAWAPATSGITVNDRSLQQTQDEVTVTAQGFVAEIHGDDATVLGPFPTSEGERGRRVFGVDLRDLGAEQLGLLAQPLPGIPAAASDFAPGVLAPGFDTSYSVSIGDPAPEKFDFALFSFDSPVTVGSVVVDDASNFDRNVWMATGSTAPDFSGGLLGALSGFDVVNSADDAGDGLFSHPLNASTVSYLLVGAPPRNGLGPLSAGSSQFYIAGFDATLSAPTPGGGGGGGGGTGVVPLPAALPLLGGALLSLGGLAAWRRPRRG